MPRLQLAVLVLLVQVPAAARSQDVINVLDRGAVPNDPRPAAAAANWTAFRGAISALTATGRAGTIYFPGGNTYYFTDGDLGAVVRPVAGAAGITIRGDGMSSVVRPVTESGSAASFVNLQGSVNLRIQDMFFYAWNHVVHDAAGGFWIDGLFTGNWLTGCGAEGAISARLVSLRIQENVWDVLHGPAIVAKPGSEYGVIQGNLFYDQNNLVANGRTSLPTIDLAGTNFDVRASAVQQWDISGNVFYQSVQMGEPVQDALRAIKVNGARGILVRGNVISAIEGHGISLGETAGVKDTIVSDNVIEPMLGGRQPSSVEGIGILVNGGQSITVRGNTIKNPRAQGISVVRSTGALVDGNTVIAALGSHGIAVTGGSGTTIRGNRSSDNAGSGIAVDGTVRPVIAGNRTWNNDAADVGGAGGVAHANIYVKDTTGAEVTGNHCSTEGRFAHFGIQVDGTADRTIIRGNVLDHYRTRPLDLRSGTSHVVDQESNHVGIVPGTRVLSLSADGHAIDPLSDQSTLVVTATANGTITLPAGPNAYGGMRYRIVRPGTEAHAVDVGGLKTIPSGTRAWVEVLHDGAAWRLVGYGTL